MTYDIEPLCDDTVMTRDLAPSSKSVANRSCRDQNDLSNLLGSSKFQAVEPFPTLSMFALEVLVRDGSHLQVGQCHGCRRGGEGERFASLGAATGSQMDRWALGTRVSPNDAVYFLLGGVSWCIYYPVWQFGSELTALSLSFALCISTQLSSYLYLFIYLSIYSHIFILFNFFPLYTCQLNESIAGRPFVCHADPAVKGRRRAPGLNSATLSRSAELWAVPPA